MWHTACRRPLRPNKAPPPALAGAGPAASMHGPQQAGSGGSAAGAAARLRGCPLAARQPPTLEIDRRIQLGLAVHQGVNMAHELQQPPAARRLRGRRQARHYRRGRVLQGAGPDRVAGGFLHHAASMATALGNGKNAGLAGGNARGRAWKARCMMSRTAPLPPVSMRCLQPHAAASSEAEACAGRATWHCGATRPRRAQTGAQACARGGSCHAPEAVHVAAVPLHHLVELPYLLPPCSHPAGPSASTPTCQRQQPPQPRPASFRQSASPRGCRRP